MTSENADNTVQGNQPTQNSDTKTADHADEAKGTCLPLAAKPDAQPCRDHTEITCNTKRDWIDWITLGLEGFGLFVLIIYTVATIAIWRANKKAADAAKTAADAAIAQTTIAKQTVDATIQQFHLDQRAWLIATASQTTPIPPDNPIGPQRLHTTISIQNTGKTPALRAKGWIKLQRIWPIYGDKLDFSHTAKNSSVVNIPVIYPNASPAISVLGPLYRGHLSDDFRAEIFVSGEIHYCDVFYERHWINFCLAWTGDGYKACDGVPADKNNIDDPAVREKCN